MPIVIAALLGLSGLVIVLYPLLGLERERADAGLPAPATELADRERLAKTALREVEFDHALGNLDDADYHALRQRYERRALAALRVRYQREQELDARIERELAALRAGGNVNGHARPATRRVAAEAPTTPDAAAPRRTSATPSATPSATQQSAPAPRGPRARRGRGV
jgi:cytochrome c-type biogenesis protein CcmI